MTLAEHRWFSMELDVILAASHRGFGAGAGALLRCGEIEGTRLKVDGDWIAGVGGRGAFRFAWDTVPGVPISLGMEPSERPDPRTATLASRLLYTIGYAAPDGTTLAATVGSTLRRTGSSYGWTVGGTASRDF